MSSMPFALLVPGPPGDPRSAARGRVADFVAILCALVYGAAMVLLGDATKPGTLIPWPVDVTIGVLAAAALVRRRSQPVLVSVALLPLGAISVMATGPILVALFSVAIRRPARIAFLLVSAHLAVGAVYFALQPDPAFVLWVDVVMRAVTGLAAIGWGFFLQAQRRLTRSLRAEATRLEAEQLLRVDQARLTERSRIAREMHDVLAHRMSMVSLHAGALEVRTDATPEEVATAARTIRVSAHQALEELRTVIGVLRHGSPARPEPPQPSLDDVGDLLDSARTSGMTIDFVSQVPPVVASPALGRTAYRLIQEALTNARKHAPGVAVDVVVDGQAGDNLRILVTNPLPADRPRPDFVFLPTARLGVQIRGLDADTAPVPRWHHPVDSDVPGAGMGLIGVGERVALAGGHVEYGAEGDRFRLEAWLPWPE